MFTHKPPRLRRGRAGTGIQVRLNIKEQLLLHVLRNSLQNKRLVEQEEERQQVAEEHAREQDLYSQQVQVPRYFLTEEPTLLFLARVQEVEVALLWL